MTKPTCEIEARRARGGLSALGVGYCHVPGPMAQAGMRRAFGAPGPEIPSPCDAMGSSLPSAKGANDTSLGHRPRGKGAEIRGRAESPSHARIASVSRSGRGEETCGVHGSGFQPSTGVVRGWPCVPGPLAQAGMKRAFGANGPRPHRAMLSSVQRPYRLMLWIRGQRRLLVQSILFVDELHSVDVFFGNVFVQVREGAIIPLKDFIQLLRS